MLTISDLLAQTQGLPDPTPQLRRDQARQEELRRQLEAAPTVRFPRGTAASATRLPSAETDCQRIDEVRVQGIYLNDIELNLALAGPDADDAPISRCLGVAGIQVLIDRLRNALIERGYITSRVYAPSQDLSSGVLALQVVPGLIGEIRPSPGHSLPGFSPLQHGRVLNLRDIEQSLENLRRIPGAQAEFTLIPGEQADTSDLELRHTPRPRPLGLNLSVDDSGSRATGKHMGQATVSWYSPLDMGDLAYISTGQDIGHRQPSERGNRNQTVHYSLPWGYWLWSITSSQSNYHQTVVGAFQSYIYSGQSQTQDLALSHVLHRDADGKTSLRIKGFSRASRNFIDDAEVQVQQRRTGGWEAALTHSHQWPGLAADLELAYRRGTGAFGAMRAPEELFGEGSSRMGLGLATLGLQWPLGWVEGAQVSQQFRLQWNRTPLVPQDRMCLGGRYTVRGFDGVQVLCGDRGLLLRNEVQLPLSSSSNWPLAGYAALDAGRVGGRSTQDLTHRYLTGYALGLRLQQRSTQGLLWHAEVFAGRPISKPSFLHTASVSSGFNLNLAF